MSKLIAYFRVSTKRQGESGLGLDAQRAAFAAFAAASGGETLAEHTEVESGKRNDRPALAAALAQARRSKATLVVAKLDRLARNVAFVSKLMEAGVDFVACDNPHANRLTIHILAAVAEDEARRISERTIVALKAAKARGALLGSARPGHWAGNEDARLTALARGRKSSAAVRRAKSIAAIADLMPEMQQRRAAGESYEKIADALNAAGHETNRGNKWGKMTVREALNRASA